MTETSWMFDDSAEGPQRMTSVGLKHWGGYYSYTLWHVSQEITRKVL